MLFIFSELYEHIYAAVLARNVLAAKLTLFYFYAFVYILSFFFPKLMSNLHCKGIKTLKSYTKQVSDNKYVCKKYLKTRLFCNNKFSDRTFLARTAVLQI